MDEPREWDVALRNVNPGSGTLQATIPAAIGVQLKAAGYNRARLTITDDGLLYRPYHQAPDDRNTNSRERVALPDWSNTYDA